MNLANWYNGFMESVGDWIERKYLEWQIKNGRSTVERFAEYLGVTGSYILQMMSGRKKSIRKGTALMICDRLNDYSLMDILGYERPEPEPIESVPPVIRSQIDAAAAEIQAEFDRLNISHLDDEALGIALRILEKHRIRFLGNPRQ